MKANSRSTFTALLLTAFGVLPASADTTNAIQRAARQHAQVAPEDARFIEAIKEVHADIRAGRLGH